MSQSLNSVEERAVQFTKVFGVAMDYSEAGSVLPMHDWEGDASDLVLDQGGIVNPGNTVGYWWDWDKWGAPVDDLPDQLTSLPVAVEPFDHEGVEALTYRSVSGGETYLSASLVEQASQVVDRDLADVAEFPPFIHPDDNFPALADFHDGEGFLLIAPRVVK